MLVGLYKPDSKQKDYHPPDTNEFQEFEKTLLRQQWLNHIIESDPRLFVTFKFLDTRIRKGTKEKSVKQLQPLSDEFALAAIDKMLKQCNKRLFNHRKRHYLQGYAALEHQKCGNPDIHLLLSNDIQPDDLAAATVQVLKAAKRKEQRYGELNPFKRLNANSIDIQQIYDAEGVTRYCTKLFEIGKEKMLLVTPDGIME